MPESADERLAKATAWLNQQKTKKKTRLATAGEAVDRFLAKAGLARRVAQAGVVEEWARLVGPQIAAVTQAESVSPDGVLRVLVATAAWANELSLMTPRILARVNDGRAGRIREIRWQVSDRRQGDSRTGGQSNRRGAPST
jgi:predicted nucleic acid-binding Zn ribbon protein